MQEFESLLVTPSAAMLNSGTTHPRTLLGPPTPGAQSATAAGTFQQQLASALVSATPEVGRATVEHNPSQNEGGRGADSGPAGMPFPPIEPGAVSVVAFNVVAPQQVPLVVSEAKALRTTHLVDNAPTSAPGRLQVESNRQSGPKTTLEATTAATPTTTIENRNDANVQPATTASPASASPSDSAEKAGAAARLFSPNDVITPPGDASSIRSSQARGRVIAQPESTPGPNDPDGPPRPSPVLSGGPRQTAVRPGNETTLPPPVENPPPTRSQREFPVTIRPSQPPRATDSNGPTDPSVGNSSGAATPVLVSSARETKPLRPLTSIPAAGTEPTIPPAETKPTPAPTSTTERPTTDADSAEPKQPASEPTANATEPRRESTKTASTTVAETAGTVTKKSPPLNGSTHRGPFVVEAPDPAGEANRNHEPGKTAPPHDTAPSAAVRASGHEPATPASPDAAEGPSPHRPPPERNGLETTATALREPETLPVGKPVAEDRTTAPEPATQPAEKPQPASFREAAERPLRLPEPASDESGAKSDIASSKSHERNLPERVQLVQRVAHALRTAGPNGGRVHLRLHPPELGSLSVEVTLRDGALTARLGAVTETARSLLLEHLPTLRENLSQHGVHVDRFDVDVLGHPGGGRADQEFRHGFGQPPGEGAATPTTRHPAGREGENEETLGTPSPMTETSGLDVMA